MLWLVTSNRVAKVRSSETETRPRAGFPTSRISPEGTYSVLSLSSVFCLLSTPSLKDWSFSFFYQGPPELTPTPANHFRIAVVFVREHSKASTCSQTPASHRQTADLIRAERVLWFERCTGDRVPPVSALRYRHRRSHVPHSRGTPTQGAHPPISRPLSRGPTP